MRVVILFLLLSVTANVSAEPQTVKLPLESAKYYEVSNKVDAHATSLQEQNQQWRKRLQQEIDQVKGNQQQLTSRLTQKQRELLLLNKQLASLNQQKKQLSHDYQVAVDDMKLVEGAYQKSLNSLSQQWQQSPTQLVATQRHDLLEVAKAAPGFPSLEQLTALVGYSINDMQLTGTISNSKTAISFEDGSVSEHLVLVMGGLMAVNATPTPSFIALSDKLPIAIAPSNSHITAQLDQWINGQTQLLPMDLSQGRMLPSLANEQSIVDWVNKGGEVLWPILILAALGLLIALWRATRLFYWRPLTAICQTPESCGELIFIKQQLLLHPRVPAAAVLAHSIVAGASVESMDQRLKQLMLKQMAQFERGLGFIALLAAMAPMLGLLGTVSGMIETFQSLTEFGNSDPKLLSQGISKALITTQAGLLVALPLLLLHYPLKRRAQSLSLNMEQQSALLLALNIERGNNNVVG